MSNTPLVTVIIPTYNRAGILKHAIESALQQTYTNIQLVVVDDGSTDDTAAVVARYPAANYVFQEHAGQAAARNCGLKHAKGTILASLDSDDLWNPDFLERSVNKLEAEGCDFVFANWYQCDRHGREWDFLKDDPHIQKHHKITPDHWVTLSYANARKLYSWDCPSPSSSVVIRKSSIISGWDPAINIADDWCMYLSIILSKECKIAFTLQKLWKKRVDSINIYDGRVRKEVLKYLYIADTKHIMDKLGHLMTPKELTAFRRRYIGGLEELAKHEMLREKNWGESVRLFKTAWQTNAFDTLLMVPVTIKNLIDRQMLKFRNKSLS
ncbi:MAG: glycosyltransferase family 2 protein [Mucilaginibacter sp.]